VVLATSMLLLPLMAVSRSRSGLLFGRRFIATLFRIRGGRGSLVAVVKVTTSSVSTPSLPS
jgi:hypothetical protein